MRRLPLSIRMRFRRAISRSGCWRLRRLRMSLIRLTACAATVAALVRLKAARCCGAPTNEASSGPVSVIGLARRPDQRIVRSRNSRTDWRIVRPPTAMSSGGVWPPFSTRTSCALTP